MTENAISKIIVQSAIKIHTRLGPGLLESVYEKILAHELTSRGLEVEQQKYIPIIYDELIIEAAFRADIIVNDKVILEIKSVKELEPVHYKQLLTYLRLTDRKLGLLLNFNTELMRDGIRRVVNGLEDG